MAFSSLLFLFYFLPAFLAVYWLLPARWQNAWALFASAVFYAWGAPAFLPVIAATSIVDYLLSKRLHRPETSPHAKRQLLTVSVAMNLAVLGYFKYANFFVDQVNALLQQAGAHPLQWTAVALPIGISFLTFEKISYVVDVYRGVTPPAPTLGTYALFLGLFPHLIAGPIFRYHDIAEQLTRRLLSREEVAEGFFRFSIGLGKKVILADPLSTVADKTFGLRYAALSTPVAWYGAVAYGMQIYFDFSGYSDMAIGLGKMCGFRFVENFNAPYTSKCVTEFWRRWHISLSNWMREYLYIPLGGNRVGPARQMVNLWIVFLLSGLWHGASWNFVLWGAYHGCFLAAERTRLLRWMEQLPAVVRQAVTFLIVLVGWVPFRAVSLSEAWQYLNRMFIPFSGSLSAGTPLWVDLTSNRQTTAMVAALAFSLTVLPGFTDTRRVHAPVGVFLCRATASLLIFSVAVLALINSHFHPFIYFRF